MWATTVNYGGFPSVTGRMQSIRTSDGGKTYKTNVLFDDVNAYFIGIFPYDDKTAYLLTSDNNAPAFNFRRTVDTGATWQDMPYKPTTFPNIIYFYDANEGILICDADSIGANILYTLDSGKTFNRIPQSNVPSMDSHSEFFNGGFSYQVLGNTFITFSYNSENGLNRIWRSTDRGRNWTKGEEFDGGDPFVPRYSFYDANNGMMLRGHTSGTTNSYYTHDGGATWQEGNMPPGQNTFMLNLIPNTQTMLSVFLDTKTQMQYSMATNDLGKTWHSRKDIQKYELDTVFASLGVPTLVYTLGDVVDNYTAWAKFGRDGLYRYESTTPLAQEIPDLDLEIKADNDGLPLYGYVKYTLSVRNRGMTAATGVKINWLPPYNRTPNAGSPYAYVSAYADKGRYDSWNGVWDIEKLDAGAIGTASFHLFVLDNKKAVIQTAQVIACNEMDVDSSPNNMVGAAKEDDEIGYTAQASIADLINNAQHITKTDQLALTVSPNPTSDLLNIAINNTTDFEWSVRVINTVGQTVFSQTGQYSNTLNVDVKNLPNGLYIVDYQSDGLKKTERVLVRH